MVSKVDPANIQGSIWPRLPRYYETFLFFKIKDLEEDGSYATFKEHLRKLVESGKITTGSKCKEYLEKHDGVNEARERVDTRPEDRHTFNAINITFSGKGTTKLVGPYDELKLRDLLHERGMYQDMVFEGPDETESLAPEYRPPQDWPKNNDNWRCDGMFIVAAQREDELEATVKDLKSYFRIADDHTVDAKEASAKITLTKKGHVRNADGKARRREIPDEKDPSKKRLENLRGKEHLGFEDHISQPPIEGLDPPPKEGEPQAIPPGVIFLNRRGDNTKSPEWATDGSYLAFREIEEKVPEFNEFVKTQSEQMHTFNDGTGEKLAAYMIGRWKNGSPVVLDSENSVAQHPFANNFEFKQHYSSQKEIKCPIAAHIRKMRPRADLYISKDGGDVSAQTNYWNNTNVILRRSVTFGPELQPGEEKMKPSERPKRGIYFMCYQGDFRNGFNFLTSRWASNKVFSGKKGMEDPGQDPIVSQRNRPDHPEPTFSIYDGNQPKELKMGYLPWVDQRGGEYFFTPSMEALRGVFVNEVE
ncbi:Dyp-type peroxidase [Aspergillus ruber CBS 135680]|uniref:DyP dimeric alpha+beta barrel domain-containing protein n=1 Tax=Aspergillus ruber (strain CBS 135680) TaxID=1388766 RepID=A0A017SIW0_ASPRC|nr:uncharacterized protein EURHEDRAFT_452470 [Aspergillus ruber CBS 135680]EYE96691.1 hypothetical protein EURHEDRAFT_452470 [Aspergillus ruber CBS 135680]